MKKRLLLQLLAVVCAVSAYAYNPGDYLYSTGAKFKVTGENQVVNGSFNVGDGTQGWTNEDGEPFSAENWKITTGVGPNGENVIESVKASSKERADGDPAIWLTNSWKLTPGTYAISYWIKGNGIGNTAVPSKNSSNTAFFAPRDNYITFIKNYDGTVAIGAPKGCPNADSNPDGGTAVSTAQAYDQEWKQVVESVTIEEEEYLVFDALAVEAGVMMTNFEIYPVEEVYDTRNLVRATEYIDKLLAEESLSEGKDVLLGVKEILKSFIDNPETAESIEGMAATMEEVEIAITQFLDDNAGDTESGDWTTRSSVNWNSLNNATIVGSWKTVGIRWGFSANDGNLERPAGDGYVASAGIQTSYNLEGLGVKVERADLKPGKYFFSIEAQAVASANGSQPYGTDNSRPVVGPTVWVGNTSVTLENDTLNGDYWKRYYLIADIAEGDTVRAGFTFPTYTDSKGGRYSVRNPQFRMVGKSVTVLRWEKNIRDIITQQTELKNRIDTYPADLADYKWEQDSLARALANAQAILDQSLSIVKADGSCDVAQSDEGVDELKALYNSVLDQVNQMGRAKNWVVNSNAIQDELKKWITDAQASLDNPANATSPADLRTALQNAIKAGQTLIDGISATNQTDEFNAAIEKIKETKVAYEMPSSTRANPAPIVIQNGGFEAWTSDTNYAEGKTYEVNGWTLYAGSDIKQWQIRVNNNAYESGVNLNAWRGTTVAPTGKASQKITLTMPGLYEYRVKAYALDDNVAQFIAVGKTITEFIYDPDTDDELATLVDTVYTPNVRVFFGKDGAPDSVTVSKCVAPGDNKAYITISGYTPWMYSVFYKKTSTDPEELEFGLESSDNNASAGVNAFGFGDNKIFYVGSDEAKYINDTKADVATLITEAQALVTQYKEDANKKWLTYKLNRFIKAGQEAKTAKELQNAYWGLTEMIDVIKMDPSASTPDAIQSAVVEKNVPQGVYSITGVKVGNDFKSLKPGLYIVNGKKILVK
jgi:hypothetical protein